MGDGDTAPTLQRWLDWQSSLGSAEIDLGLDRVREVGARLGVLEPAVPVLTVAGTNGKGSIVAYLESMLTAAGYRCGAYTSPHLFHYGERVRIGGRPCTDGELIQAFEAVEAARDDVPLTYFEYGTLAALWAFQQAAVDVLVLEVGLGGRLDAVNVVDPDVAVIASIGLDHADWLGHTLDAVAREKAGIMRAGRPVVFAAPRMPGALWEAAETVSAPVWSPGDGFVHDGPDSGWRLRMDSADALATLPAPGLAGPHQRDNAAAAIVALRLVSSRLDVPASAVARGIADARLPGRCETLPGPVEWLVDVAHNADAAQSLARHLRGRPSPPGRCWAVLGVMARKERAPLIEPFAGAFDGWFLVTLPQPNAWPAADLADAVVRHDPGGTVCFAGPPQGALDALDGVLQPGDRVVAYGSFHTVEWLYALGQGVETVGRWLPALQAAGAGVASPAG